MQNLDRKDDILINNKEIDSRKIISINYNKYYINLDRSISRKLNMEKNYKNIFRVVAFDGNMLKNYDNIKLPYNTCSNKYEIACSLSHIKAIMYAYNNLDKGALIFEDDICCDYIKYWNDNIDNIINGSPSDTECLMLFCINNNEILNMINMREYYTKWNSQKWGTGCYYINRNGMKKIINMYVKKGKIDLTYLKNGHSADAHVIYPKLKTYCYTRPLFNHQCNNSIIHQDHVKRLHEPSLITIQKYFKKKKENNHCFIRKLLQ